MEVGTAESTDNILQASQAVADNIHDTDEAVVLENRLFKPRDIREYHYSKDCGNVSHCQLPMV